MECTILKKSNLSALALFILIIIPLSSAIVINQDTIIQTTVSNLTINFTQTAYADLIVIESTSIYLQNFRRSGSETITMNLTSANKNYTGNDLPYFVQTSLTEKHIASNLSDSVNTTVVVNAYSCDSLSSLTYKRNTDTSARTLSSSEWSCSNGIVTIQSLEVQPATSSNELVLLYNQAQVDTCNNFFGAGDSFIGFFGVLIIIVVAGIAFYFILGETDMDVDMGSFATVLVIAGIVIVFGMVIINTMTGCS